MEDPNAHCEQAHSEQAMAMNHNEVQIKRLSRNLTALADYAHNQSKRHGSALKQALQQAEQLAEESALATHTAAAATTAGPARVSAVSGKPGGSRRRGRVALVCWDLSHNPVGRAYVLYRLLEKHWDVDLVGPMWTRYGKSLWKPLADAGMNVRSFQCSNLADFVPRAELLAATRSYDLVVVCKPRLPALYLGSLIKQGSQCPMVVDVDDFELSFFKNHEYASEAELLAEATTALHEPFEELATRYAQTLVSEADSVTVSNVALRARFGGHIVRHARDESTFRPDADARTAARERLGIAEDDFALLFIGTPRPHKGVLEVTRALHELNDPTIVFHVVGDLTDKAFAAKLAQYDRAQVVFHPNCAFSELPVLLAAADLVPLIQDADHPISQHQIPAKISDALSLGIPVLATATPPLADLVAQGAIQATTAEHLADSIARLRARHARGELDVASCRRHFLGELSEAVNGLRLNQAIAEAMDEAQPAGGTLSPALLGLLALFRSECGRVRQACPSVIERLSDRSPPVPAPAEGKVEARPTDSLLSQKRWQRLRRASAQIMRRGGSDQGYDIAFFWKQNDSGLYGRRSDMVTRYLANSPRVRQMVHFDAPVSVHGLEQHFKNDVAAQPEQQALILNGMFERQAGMQDDDNIRRRTYVHSNHARRPALLGEMVGKKDSYVRFVREELAAAGMAPETTIAWFCPVVWEAPELIDKLGFAGVVSDLIDDQREWNANGGYIRRLEACYRDTLAESDLVFANCDSLAQAMREYAHDIQVVPNGAERMLQQPLPQRPVELADIEGPVVGYVGNLRDRIDWLLLHEVVVALPAVTFVFIGPDSDNDNAQSMARHPNVRFLGVRPYDQVPDYLRHFDAGIVPHINNALTAKMNPLKVYNYFAAGLPIISTEVSNLASLGEALQTAADPEEFIAAIQRALASPTDVAASGWQSVMDSIAWDTRVEQMLDCMDASLRRRLRRSA